MSAGRRLLGAALLGAVVVALALGGGEARAIDPETFAAVSSGIVLVRADCAAGVSSGTGFLVGSGVVMTARHVVRGCHNTRVHTTYGAWIPVTRIVPWREGDGTDVDVATLRLAEPSTGYVFHFGTRQSPIGANLAAIGHPLATDLAVTQGKLFMRARRQVFVRLLGGEGYSGAPFVDNDGNVVAILQNGYGSTDALGQRTAGVVSGYDFSSRWVAWRRALCTTYRFGGIADCP